MAIALMMVSVISLAMSPYAEQAFATGPDTGEVQNALNGLPGYCSGAACTNRSTGVARSVVDYLLYIGGIVAVVMIVVGGVQMTTSAGNPAAVAKAKRTIIWSVAGLLVAILAYAIVGFVLSRL